MNLSPDLKEFIELLALEELSISLEISRIRAFSTEKMALHPEIDFAHYPMCQDMLRRGVR